MLFCMIADLKLKVGLFCYQVSGVGLKSVFGNFGLVVNCSPINQDLVFKCGSNLSKKRDTVAYILFPKMLHDA